MKHFLVGLVALFVLTLGSSAAFAINCVAYVKSVTHFRLSGDAWEWWNAAAPIYDRGYSPAPGAVLVFSRTPRMPLGHVAVVREVMSPREILIDQANWHRARVDRGVVVIDVSPSNDWSEVNVQWQGNSFGGPFPISGFVYAPGTRWAAPDGIETASADPTMRNDRGRLVTAASRASRRRTPALHYATLRRPMRRRGAVRHAVLHHAAVHRVAAAHHAVVHRAAMHRATVRHAVYHPVRHAAPHRAMLHRAVLHHRALKAPARSARLVHHARIESRPKARNSVHHAAYRTRSAPARRPAKLIRGAAGR